MKRNAAEAVPRETGGGAETPGVAIGELRVVLHPALTPAFGMI